MFVVGQMEMLVRSNDSEGLNVGSDNDVGRLVNNFHNFESESNEMAQLGADGDVYLGGSI